MGKRGPAGTPTNLRVLKGDRKDRINTAEPIPNASSVQAPADMSAAAREVWDYYAPDLTKKRVLTGWDVDALAMYCDARVRNATARRHLDTEGEVIEAPVFDKNGKRTGERLTKSPWQFIYKETAEIMLRYGARFGLTPSDRADLSIPQQEGPGGAKRLLSS